MLDKMRLIFNKYEISPRSTFQARTSELFSENRDRTLLLKAYDFAEYEFRGVKRHNGEIYFRHKLCTALLLMEYSVKKDAEQVAMGLLHDVIGDIKKWNRKRLSREFSHRIARVVDLVSKKEGQSLASYYCGIQRDEDSAKVKIADRLHNMDTLWGSDEKKLKKLLETLRFVMPMAVKYDYLWQELNIAIAEQQRQLLFEGVRSG